MNSNKFADLRENPFGEGILLSVLVKNRKEPSFEEVLRKIDGRCLQ